MSATIDELKFVIFGSGHDYTLNNSGTGEGAMWFSHPFMAKGSRAYAGMYYFLVADENGDLIDAVKDDIAHCTFTPALGDTFDTVGEQEIRVDYRREYIYDEETLVVEKHLKQTITVVDHGEIIESDDWGEIVVDVYEDDYLLFRPATQSTFEYEISVTFGSGEFKVSSIPWRATGIVFGDYLIDISELQYADTSKVTYLELGLSRIDDLSPLTDWNVSNVTNLNVSCNAEDFKALSKWDISNVERLSLHLGSNGISLDGLEDWNTSKVEKLSLYGEYITSLIPLSAWDVSNLKDLSNGFRYFNKLESLDGLEHWNVSNLENMENSFSNNRWLSDITALSLWNTSRVRNMRGIFRSNGALTDLNALTDWDVSNVVRSGGYVSNLINAFSTVRFYHSNELGKDLCYVNNRYWDYEGNGYVISDPSVLAEYTKDASAISDWDVQDIPALAFGNNSEWTNIPSWN